MCWNMRLQSGLACLAIWATLSSQSRGRCCGSSCPTLPMSRRLLAPVCAHCRSAAIRLAFALSRHYRVRILLFWPAYSPTEQPSVMVTNYALAILDSLPLILTDFCERTGFSHSNTHNHFSFHLDLPHTNLALGECETDSVTFKNT